VAGSNVCRSQSAWLAYKDGTIRIDPCQGLLDHPRESTCVPMLPTVELVPAIYPPASPSLSLDQSAGLLVGDSEWHECMEDGITELVKATNI
jgi:hypothetical protein